MGGPDASCYSPTRMREAESGRLVFAPVLLRASAVFIDLAILVVLGLGV